jgi:hypothetical protein
MKIDDQKFWKAVLYISQTPFECSMDSRIYHLIYNCRALMTDHSLARRAREMFGDQERNLT